MFRCTWTSRSTVHIAGPQTGLQRVQGPTRERAKHCYPEFVAGASADQRSAWFVAWTAIGALLTVGAISLGFFVVLVALSALLLLLTVSSARRSFLGLFVGIGSVCLLVALINREGDAAERLNPVPWLVIGLVLTFGPLIYYRARAAVRTHTAHKAR